MTNRKRIFSSKIILPGMLAIVLIAAPAQAQTVDFSCTLTPLERQSFVTLGYPNSAGQVMHLSVDQNAGKVTVWESTPEFPNGNKSVYQAEFAGTTAAWTIGGDEDEPPAHDSLDSGTNVLTTIDPEGEATQWDCSPG